MFNMFLETEVCSVEVVNRDEDAIECISSVSSYSEDSTSEDSIEEVSVVVVIAPIGFKPIVDAEPPAPEGIGIPGPGRRGSRLLRRGGLGTSPLVLPEARPVASLLLRAKDNVDVNNSTVCMLHF